MLCPPAHNASNGVGRETELTTDGLQTEGTRLGSIGEKICLRVGPDCGASTFEIGKGLLQNREHQDLLAHQELYGASGGVHMSALSDGGRFVASAEDIGRHNTLDKVAGRCLLDRVTGPRRAIVTTGRVSSEMIQKARRIGVPLVVSRTAPAARSVDLAERWGMTLVGYARKDRFVAYSHAGRIVPNGRG